MKAFKLKYQKIKSGVTLSVWLTEQDARTWFDLLKADSNCLWCELLYTPEDTEYIMDEFVR